MNDEKLFTSRLCDMVRSAENGCFAASAFLTPEECALARKYLQYNFPESRYSFYGGYPEAERCVLVLFPDWADTEHFDTSEYFEAIFIRPAGYEKLTHSACLGALMNCSIERSAIGDIVITDEGAFVFVQRSVAKLLLTETDTLVRVGREKVKILPASAEDVGNIKREYEEVTFVMSSCRVDCLVSEITGLSREKVKGVISSGEVLLCHKPVEDISERFQEGDVISVRGSGKYIIKELSETKKGRLRVSALKYK